MITGISVVWRRRRSTSMPSMRGILTSRMTRSGGSALDRVQARRAVVIRLHHVAMAFQRQRNRGDDVLVVVDESNIGHRALWVLSRISCRYYRPASPATTRGPAKLSRSFAAPAWRDCGEPRPGRFR